MFRINVNITSAIFKTAYNIIQWYDSRFYGFWNTMLAFNRFTALFLFKQHKQIWKGWRLAIIFGITLAYPFILNGYFLKNYHCFESDWQNINCTDFFTSSNTVPISNGINAIVALVLGLTTAFARKIKGNTWQKKQKYETYLLVTSIMASILLALSELFTFLAGDFISKNANFSGFNFQTYLTAKILVSVSNWFAVLFYTSPIALLYCLSKAVRESFVCFYHLYLTPGIRNPKYETEIISEASQNNLFQKRSNS